MTDSVTPEDRRDIDLSLAGDGEAYGRLVRRYQDAVGRQMRRFSRDPVQWEELVQDVFVEAYFSLKSFQGRSPFLHWLRKIATRTGYRFWKARYRRRERADDPADLALLAGPAQSVDPAEAADLVHRLLAALDPPDRLVLTLLYVEELDTAQIADRTGWSRTLVKVRAHRARKKLKKVLDRMGLEAADV